LKKVLVITYYWPPSGGPGVQRVLKFCKYLPEFGWEPIVLTVKDGEYPNIDLSLEKEAESLGIRVMRTKTSEPFALYKWMTGKKSMPSYELNKTKSGNFTKLSKWVRMNYFIPDARKGWIPFGVHAGRELLKNEKIDIIFSSGPPHSLHFIAKKLKEEFNIPWVADFRDPWTDLFYYDGHERSARALKKDAEMEKVILSSADTVTTTSEGITELLEKKSTNNYHTIYNGYDEDDFKKIQEKPTNGEKSIVITHVGSMAKSQVPRTFFKVISDLKKDGFNLSLKFIGDLHQTAVNTIREFDLESVIDHKGYLTHSNAVKHMVNSDFLLLIIPKTKKNSSIIPGKVFEYIRSNTPIILIGPKGSEASKIIHQTMKGKSFEYSDESGIAKYLQSPQKCDVYSRIEFLSRKHLTKQLSDIIDSIK